MKAQLPSGFAVTLSGGGHRATLFGLGALLYLVDTGAHNHVTSIASVSGGSLTNGFVGQTLDFRATDPAAFRQNVVERLATQIARKGTLFAPVLTKLYLALLIITTLAIFLPFFIAWDMWYVRLPLQLVILAVWGSLFGLRGRLCAYAFDKTLFSPKGGSTALSQINSLGIDHVICSTEMRAAEQVCFAGSFVYSYCFGLGVPGDLTLAKAVQASACFPGGFPPTYLATQTHAFAAAPVVANCSVADRTEFVLTDGGVYDNMGEQWARGLVDRLQRIPALANGRAPAEKLIVVNASARFPWVPYKHGHIPIVSEILALLRMNDVMYINTTNVRRQEIIASFDPTHPENATRMPSVLIQIAQSPFVVAKGFANAPGDVGSRALTVLAALGNTENEWSKIADDNARVATTLQKLGKAVSARLLYHGYVVAMCNLYVLFGPPFQLSAAELDIERFEVLIQ